jgi:hypothetical protein
MILLALLAILGIAAECVTKLLFKAHEMTPDPSMPKEIKHPMIVGEPDSNSCLVGSWEPGGAEDGMMNEPMERYTRFVEDNSACFPLFDENLADEGIISIAGIASPAFSMTIPQWEMVFGI